MRVSAIHTLFCLCAMICAQADVYADPDDKLRFDGIEEPTIWQKLSGTFELKDKALKLAAEKVAPALLKADAKNAKPTKWFGFGVQVKGAEGKAPQAGLAFAVVDARNYCKCVLRDGKVLIAQVKDGVETVINTLPLKAAPKADVQLGVHFREDRIIAVYVDEERVYSWEYGDPKTEVSKVLKDWAVPQGALGVICETGTCTFTEVGARGIAKH